MLAGNITGTGGERWVRCGLSVAHVSYTAQTAVACAGLLLADVMGSVLGAAPHVPAWVPQAILIAYFCAHAGVVETYWRLCSHLLYISHACLLPCLVGCGYHAQLSYMSRSCAYAVSLEL